MGLCGKFSFTKFPTQLNLHYWEIARLFFNLYFDSDAVHVHVVVQFYPWFKSYFPLFLGMVMCDNEFETMKIKFKPRIK